MYCAVQLGKEFQCIKDIEDYKEGLLEQSGVNKQLVV